MLAPYLLPAAVVLALSVSAAGAQDTKTTEKAVEKSVEKSRTEDVVIEQDGRRARVFTRAEAKPRAMLGVSTSSSGIRDTLGILVTAVTPGGPAEKAGIVEGNRIASINGVNLRLAAADAGEPDMSGITVRRLTRELGKVQPGAEVNLRIYADGQWRNVRVRTVSSDSLGGDGRRVRVTRASADERPVLGIELHPTGSRRDTLGVLVIAVHENGPAEKAGLVEGDRVMAVNGTDVRVRRDDMGDDFVSHAMVSRFQRVMRGVKPGDRVELRVYSGGQAKTVQVTAARAADVYKDRQRVGMMPPMSFHFDGPMHGVHPGVTMAPMPAMPPLPPMTPRARIHSMDLDDLEELELELDEHIDTHDVHEMTMDADVQAELMRAREEAKAAREESRRLREALTNVQRGLDRSTSRSASGAITPAVVPGVAYARLAALPGDLEAETTEASLGAPVTTEVEPGRSTFRVAGLTLARVTPDLAEYLGEGSRDGYLVLESVGSWSAVHPGDVLLAVDGHCVRDGSIHLVEDSAVQQVTVLRKGKKTTVRLT